MSFNDLRRKELHVKSTERDHLSAEKKVHVVSKNHIKDAYLPQDAGRKCIQ